MCGIAGLWQFAGPLQTADLRHAAQSMADAIAHRGPDDHGVWADATCGVVLAHRRLAIVDLSPAGHQPMRSADGRYTMVFNGEIYNFKSLRAELQALGAVFRSHSDTEVMLEGFCRWGVAGTVRKLAGMWAFALWDAAEHCLHLCRDRMGKKPLYVHTSDRGLAFASELKALWKAPGFQAHLNQDAVHGFFRFGYVAENECILEGVFKIQPGEVVKVSGRGAMDRQRYWSLAEVVERSATQRLTHLAEAEEVLLDVLRTATRERMVADVPLGAFLSGGVDSGLVVALMQEAASTPTRTFSIGFEEATHNEAPIAKAVAAHLGTDHTELYVTQRAALDVVPRMGTVFDEPFADASQLPTTLLAALARPHVTVALTGDGGDEAFGGYVRYRSESGVVGRLLGLPGPIRHAGAGLLSAMPSSAWDALSLALPHSRRPRFLASKVHKLARALRSVNASQRRKLFLTLWDDMDGLLRGPPRQLDQFADVPAGLQLPASEAMQFWETMHYLPGDLLTKMDRAAMAASLEARSPLLDHRAVETAWRLAPDLKAGPQALKFILRRLLFKYVPQSLVDLPKQGFSVPLGQWLLQDLRPFAEESLAYTRQHLSDLIDPAVVDAAWRAHTEGRIGYVERLWSLVMFAQWHRQWLGRPQG